MAYEAATDTVLPLDNTQRLLPELLASHKGQTYAEHGFRFLKDPQFLASSLCQKPEGLMALLIVMTAYWRNVGYISLDRYSVRISYGLI